MNKKFELTNMQSIAPDYGKSSKENTNSSNARWILGVSLVLILLIFAGCTQSQTNSPAPNFPQQNSQPNMPPPNGIARGMHGGFNGSNGGPRFNNSQFNNSQIRQQFLQQLTNACSGLNIGDACTVQTPQVNRTGVCAAFNDTTSDSTLICSIGQAMNGYNQPPRQN